MLTISSKGEFPLRFTFFCFFLSVGGPWRALMIRAEGERTNLHLALPVLLGQFYRNPQTLPTTGCFGAVNANVFWRQTQGASRVALTSPRVLLWYTTWTLLGLSSRGTEEAAGVGGTRIWDDLSLLRAPNQKNGRSLDYAGYPDTLR